jgi:hypothetical protein
MQLFPWILVPFQMQFITITNFGELPQNFETHPNYFSKAVKGVCFIVKGWRAGWFKNVRILREIIATSSLALPCLTA